MFCNFFARAGNAAVAATFFSHNKKRVTSTVPVYRTVAVFLCAIIFSINPPAHATAPMSEAEWVLAVARFVEWPNTGLRDLVVCSQPTDAPLLLNNKFVRGLRIVEKNVRTIADIKSCHLLVLFAERNPSRWIQATRGLPILTIGYGREFCIYGGIVCVLGASDNAPAHHSVNLETLARAGLYARNELLIPQGAYARTHTQK
jgi:YfiR/HmsC-like